MIVLFFIWQLIYFSVFMEGNSKHTQGDKPGREFKSKWNGYNTWMNICLIAAQMS